MRDSIINVVFTVMLAGLGVIITHFFVGVLIGLGIMANL